MKLDASKVEAEQTRRQFLAQLSAASLAALASGSPRMAAASTSVQHPTSTADTCILLWMAGGMAATETLDPKHYVPFQVDGHIKDIGSTFPAIKTSVEGIQITEGLEQIARVMDRGTLIRSHHQPDLGNILHSRHQYHWHTGYVPPQTVAAPHIGAWMAKVLGPRNPAIPGFIDIGQRLEGVGENEELKAFHTAGFLGAEYGPLLLPHPDQAVAAVRPPQGMTPERFERRFKYFRELVRRSPNGNLASDYHQDSMLRAMENAYRLLNSPERHAFDLALEPKESYDKYNTGRFGLGCLLARRLTEVGARFIEVTTEFVPAERWDTHESGHTTVKRLKQEIDQPIAQLILDLEQRKLLDRTLVVVASEFSRDMIIEGIPGSTAHDTPSPSVMQELKHYGPHRHFTGGSSVLMFGGGIKRGFLYGSTANERPFLANQNPVSIEDLHATIFTAMGISPKTAFDIEQRPFYATMDGLGKPVMTLFV